MARKDKNNDENQAPNETIGLDNTTASGNLTNVENLMGSNNFAKTDNTGGSSNTTGSGNATNHISDIHSGNEIMSGNSIASGNTAGSGNTVLLNDIFDRSADRSDFDSDSGAADDLLNVTGQHTDFTADDISVAMNTLQGKGNDSGTVVNGTNALDESDTIKDIDFDFDGGNSGGGGRGPHIQGRPDSGEFFQDIDVTGGDADANDGVDDNLEFSDVVGDVSGSVTNMAATTSAGMAQGLAQDLSAGSNTTLNETSIDAVGGAESVSLSDTMSYGRADFDVASGNVDSSLNQQNVGNDILSGNGASTGNTWGSDNTKSSNNDTASDKSIGSDNSLGSENDMSSNNTTASNNFTSESYDWDVSSDRTDTDLSDFAANDLIDISGGADVLLDDVTVDYGSLTGAGNDMSFDLDQANSLTDNDNISDISFDFNGDFTQELDVHGGQADAGDAVEGDSVVSDIIGDVSIDLANLAETNAIAEAQGLSQNISTGGNVMLNTFDMSVIGGDSNMEQSFDDMIA